MSLLLLVFAPLSVGAQNDLSAFFPMAVGDLWSLESPSASAVSKSLAVVITSTEPVDGRKVVRREQSDGSYRVQRLDKEGLWLESEIGLGDVATVYDPPVLLVPANLGVAASHRAETPYRTLTLERETDRGTQIYEVARLPNETVTVPAGTFEKCLVLTIRGTRTGIDGSSSTLERKEWRAAGIGLVKLVGDSEWPSDTPGAKRAALDLVLGGAIVGGRVVEPQHGD